MNYPRTWSFVPAVVIKVLAALVIVEGLVLFNVTREAEVCIENVDLHRTLQRVTEDGCTARERACFICDSCDDLLRELRDDTLIMEAAKVWAR